MATRNRTKISACYNSFEIEIDRLTIFDFANHEKFTNGELSRMQIELMVESIFFAGYRSYENFIREIFLLYCQEKQSTRRPLVKSYLKPKNFEHTELLIKSSMPFLDWTAPDQVIERAELYLQNGHPIKLPYTTNLQQLRDYKRLRNHIAHNSLESELQFEKIVRNYYGGIRPLRLPTTGQFLMLPGKSITGNYLLMDFFDLMKKISIDLT